MPLYLNDLLTVAFTGVCFEFAVTFLCNIKLRNRVIFFYLCILLPSHFQIFAFHWTIACHPTDWSSEFQSFKICFSSFCWGWWFERTVCWLV